MDSKYTIKFKRSTVCPTCSEPYGGLPAMENVDALAYQIINECGAIEKWGTYHQYCAQCTFQELMSAMVEEESVVWVNEDDPAIETPIPRPLSDMETRIAELEASAKRDEPILRDAYQYRVDTDHLLKQYRESEQNKDKKIAELETTVRKQGMHLNDNENLLRNLKSDLQLARDISDDRYTQLQKQRQLTESQEKRIAELQDENTELQRKVELLDPDGLLALDDLSDEAIEKALTDDSYGDGRDYDYEHPDLDYGVTKDYPIA